MPCSDQPQKPAERPRPRKLCGSHWIFLENLKLTRGCAKPLKFSIASWLLLSRDITTANHGIKTASTAPTSSHLICETFTRLGRLDTAQDVDRFLEDQILFRLVVFLRRRTGILIVFFVRRQ